jgi:hypothetical protein
MLVPQFKLRAVPDFRTQFVPDNVYEGPVTDSQVVTGIPLLKKYIK